MDHTNEESNNILIQLLEKYPNKKWNYSFISANPNLTTKYLIKTENDLHWNWSHISHNPNIDINYILQHPIATHKNHLLSSNINFTMDLILNIMSTNVDIISWYGLSQNPNITEEFIEANHQKIDWYWLSDNPSISTDFIEKHLDHEWDWSKISRKTNLTKNFITKYQNQLDWDYISANPICDMEFLLTHSDKMNWTWFSLNPSTF